MAETITGTPWWRPRPLEWMCEMCVESIADGEGYIHINYGDIGRVEQQAKAWEDEHRPKTEGFHFLRASAYATYPPRVRWRVHHAVCDPDPHEADYFFDVSRARSHADLLDWTAQLMEKDWIGHTNWGELIRRKAMVDA